MNLMILSPGRRVEIINYFKDEFHKEGRFVYTLDMSKLSPALYFGDEYFVVEKDFANLDKYINNVIEICKRKNVSYVISLIDPELELLAENKIKLVSNGITPIVSQIEFVKSTFDKFGFYMKYKDVIDLVPTYRSFDDINRLLKSGEIRYPIFAKLKNGSASIGIKKINQYDDLTDIIENKDYIYQPFIDGEEYGVDAYFDLISGCLVSIFIKKKLSMRAGETDKSISVRSKMITELIKSISKIKGLYGPIDIDIFEDVNGKLYINEINPRFGGGHPHAYGCGVNFMKFILNNVNGLVNEPQFDTYKEGVLMLKYNGLFFKNENDE